MTCSVSRFRKIPTIVLFAAALAGCAKDGGQQSVAAKRAKPGPEESFELIVETFRRGVEDVRIGFVVPDEHGHSMMYGKNEVSHELIPPTKEGEPYKAVITVDSKSSYSIQRSGSSSDDDENDQRQDVASVEDLANDPGGLEILDDDLVSGSPTGNSSNRGSGDAASEPIVRRQAEDWPVRKYELEYRNGRWELVTKPDPETEQSIQNAFDQALKTQI
jgi:hypothetical protein